MVRSPKLGIPEKVPVTIEIGRKIVHALWSVSILLFHRWGLVSVAWILFVFLLADFCRIEFGWTIPIVGRLIRNRDISSFNTGTQTMMGIVLAYGFFTPIIATTSIAMMAFGDIAANLVGRRFHQKLANGKSIAGFIGGLLVNIILGVAILQNIPLALVMAIVASLTELFTSHLEDNFFMTVFAGFAGQVCLVLLIGSSLL